MNELNDKEDKQLEEAIRISKQSYKLGESFGNKYNIETINLQKKNIHLDISYNAHVLNKVV